MKMKNNSLTQFNYGRGICELMFNFAVQPSCQAADAISGF